MNDSSDRRKTKAQVTEERRKAQRRKNNKVEQGAPVRRDDDWDKIDNELKD